MIPYIKILLIVNFNTLLVVPDILTFSSKNLNSIEITFLRIVGLQTSKWLRKILKKNVEMGKKTKSKPKTRVKSIHIYNQRYIYIYLIPVLCYDTKFKSLVVGRVIVTFLETFFFFYLFFLIKTVTAANWVNCVWYHELN